MTSPHNSVGDPGKNHAAVAIVRASSPDDFDAARSLLTRYLRWLEELVGSDLASVQPSAVRELADLEHFYESPSGHLLMATVGGRPAGVVGVHRMGPGVGELKRLYVAPEARGLGIGRALVGAAVEAAGGLCFDALRLETYAGYMPTAVALYREAGFREAEPYHSVVGVDGLLTMELRLPLHCQAA